jgi:hypothetical protein
MKWNTNEPKRYQIKAHGANCPCAECSESRAVEEFERSISKKYVENYLDQREQALGSW